MNERVAFNRIERHIRQNPQSSTTVEPMKIPPNFPADLRGISCQSPANSAQRYAVNPRYTAVVHAHIVYNTIRALNAISAPRFSVRKTRYISII